MAASKLSAVSFKSVSDAVDMTLPYPSAKWGIRAGFRVRIRVVSCRHGGWQQKVQDFFSSEFSQQSWSSLLQLKELGKTDAFSCGELNSIVSQVEAVLKWMLRVEEVVRSSLESETTIMSSLIKIKNSLHRSLYIYEKLKGSKVRSKIFLLWIFWEFRRSRIYYMSYM